MSSNKILLIIPYFGKFPNYAKYFFQSVKYNSNIVDVLLLTDQDISLSENNIFVKKITFKELKKLVQSKFSFDISLNKPYKLCDYRPAYGYIFEDLLADYDFWGHCDLDQIFGDISKFLTDEVFNKYDKIGQHGHLTLYRNTYDNNRVFMKQGGNLDYKKVFQSSRNFVFDEILGIQTKFNELGLETYKNWDFFDVNPWKYHLRRVVSHVPSKLLADGFDYEEEVIFWKNGKVYVFSKEDGLKEMLYVHFQKRRMNIENDEEDMPFFISNESFDFYKNIDLDNINFKKENKFSISKEFRLWFKKNLFVWKRRFYNKIILKISERIMK